MTALTRDERRRLTRRADNLLAEMRELEDRCAREGGFVVGSPDELRLRSVTADYDEAELVLLEDEWAQQEDSFRAATL